MLYQIFKKILFLSAKNIEAIIVDKWNLNWAYIISFCEPRAWKIGIKNCSTYFNCHSLYKYVNEGPGSFY